MNHNSSVVHSSTSVDGRNVWQHMYDRHVADQAARAAAADAARDDGQASPLGLSTLHTSPRVSKRPPVARVSCGGGVVELRGPAWSDAPPVGGKRGVIAGFSKASRRRLLRLLGAVNREAVPFLPLFVTLTYPAAWPADPAKWKRDLDTFCKRLVRKFPKVCVVWKLEPQKRGAPHFHLLVFGVERIDKGWLRRAWYEVVGSGDYRHLVAGTRVERVKSWRGVMAYAAKYMGKVEEAANFPEYVGRWWGIYGRDYLPVQWYVERLNLGAFWAIRRILRRFLRKRGVWLRSRRYTGVSVFLEADVGFRLLDFCLGGV